MKISFIAAGAAMFAVGCVSGVDRAQLRKDQEAVSGLVKQEYLANLDNVVEYCVARIEGRPADPALLKPAGFVRDTVLGKEYFIADWKVRLASAGARLNPRSDGCDLSPPQNWATKLSYVSPAVNRANVVDILRKSGFEISDIREDAIGAAAQGAISTALFGFVMSSTNFQFATRGETEIEMSMTNSAGTVTDVIIRKPEPEEEADETR